MAEDNLSLEFIGKQLAIIMAEQRLANATMHTMMALAVGQADWNRQFEQRLAQFDQRLVDQVDILVAEFKGRIGISQVQVEKALDELTDRVEELETGRSRFTP